MLQIKFKRLNTIYYFGMIGAICFELAIETIDSGKHSKSLHGIGAVGFFLLWTINMVWVTKYFTQIRALKPSFISEKSLRFKKICITSLLVIAVVEAIRYIFGFMELNSTAPELSITEWSAMFLLCLYIYSFHWDTQNFQFNLVEETTQKSITVSVD